MPTYDYKCKACDHAFEVFHSMTEIKRKCPKCGKNALERLIGTGGAILFKGSGFYQTDYRSESYKKAAAGENGTGGEKKAGSSDGVTKAASGPKTESSGQSKPSTTTETKREKKAPAAG